MANKNRKYYVKNGDNGYKEFEVNKKLDDTVGIIEIICMIIFFPIKVIGELFSSIFGSSKKWSISLIITNYNSYKILVWIIIQI